MTRPVVVGVEGTESSQDALVWAARTALARHTPLHVVHAVGLPVVGLETYRDDAVEQAARDLVETAQRTGASISGPVPLPTEKNVYCVIRSPFKDKDSREHFEIRTHKRLIDIKKPTPKTVDSLMRLDLPAGIDIEIKL